MFGDKPIYGQSTVHPDSKGRVVLPSFTQAEENDQLLIIKDPNGIRISKEQMIDEYIVHLEKMLKEEFNPLRRQPIEDTLNSLYEKILKSVSCDRQHRIITRNILIPGNEYLIIGCRTSILIKEKDAKTKKLDLSYLGKEFKTNS